MEKGNEQVDQLDADEGNHQAAEAVDKKVVAQQFRRLDRPIRHPSQRQRHQKNDDQGIEDDGREDGAAGVASPMTLSVASCG